MEASHSAPEKRGCTEYPRGMTIIDDTIEGPPIQQLVVCCIVSLLHSSLILRLACVANVQKKREKKPSPSPMSYIRIDIQRIFHTRVCGCARGRKKTSYGKSRQPALRLSDHRVPARFSDDSRISSFVARRSHGGPHEASLDVLYRSDLVNKKRIYRTIKRRIGFSISAIWGSITAIVLESAIIEGPR